MCVRKSIALVLLNPFGFCADDAETVGKVDLHEEKVNDMCVVLSKSKEAVGNNGKQHTIYTLRYEQKKVYLHSRMKYGQSHHTHWNKEAQKKKKHAT